MNSFSAFQTHKFERQQSVLKDSRTQRICFRRATQLLFISCFIWWQMFYLTPDDLDKPALPPPICAQFFFYRKTIKNSTKETSDWRPCAEIWAIIKNIKYKLTNKQCDSAWNISNVTLSHKYMWQSNERSTSQRFPMFPVITLKFLKGPIWCRIPFTSVF